MPMKLFLQAAEVPVKALPLLACSVVVNHTGAI